ncbi:Golgi pH regulator B [Rhizophlyctis rosea]|nr:Golgi pH regulator B [Rhizophlyctis rosea]
MAATISPLSSVDMAAAHALPTLPSLFSSSLVVLGSYILFFGVGWVYVLEKLFADYEVRNKNVGLVFSATFAASCTLFEMVIFEIGDVLDRRKVTDADINLAEKKLLQTMEMLLNKKKKLALASRKQRVLQEQGTQGVGGFMRNVFNRVTSSFSADQNTNHLRTEITALETVLRHLFMDLDDLNMEKERIKDARTLKGKYFNLMGYIFAGLCIYKVVTSTLNIITNRMHHSTGRDPITNLLEVVVHRLGWTIDVGFWSQQMSFVVVGILVFVSIRGLLIIFMKFFRAFSSSISPSNIGLFLAHVLGMYCLSSVLMMRMNLPEQNRTIITDVLGRIEFNFYHRWFDVIFLVSAIASGVFILFLTQLQKQREAEMGMWSGSSGGVGSRGSDTGVAVAILLIGATYDQSTALDTNNERVCLLLHDFNQLPKQAICQAVIYGGVACTGVALILGAVNAVLYARKGRGVWWVFISRLLTDLTMLFALAMAILHTIGIFQTCKSLGDPLPDKIGGCKVDYNSYFKKNLDVVYAGVAGVWALWLLWFGYSIHEHRVYARMRKAPHPQLEKDTAEKQRKFVELDEGGTTPAAAPEMSQPKGKSSNGGWGSWGDNDHQKETPQQEEEESYQKKDEEWSGGKEEKSGWGTWGGGEKESGGGGVSNNADSAWGGGGDGGGGWGGKNNNSAWG